MALLRRALRPAAWLRVVRFKLLRQQPAQDRTRKAEARLWGGYSTYASDELNEIIRSPLTSPEERARAAWELARWHAFQGEPDLALKYLRLIPPQIQTRGLVKSRLLLEVRTLMTLGRMDEARSLANGALLASKHDSDVHLVAANTLLEAAPGAEEGDSNDERRLALVNQMYARRGLLPIRKIDSNLGLSLDNITATPPPDAIVSGGPTVSVIMPAYNAAATIGFALRSLQEQTWRNLQIIVVDDASSDETVAVVSEAARHDDRICIVRLDRNQGSYVASNTALERATGEYVTTHGADDWSHPQKIELQVREPLGGDFAASETFLVRTSQDLRFNGCWRPKETLLEENISSFMLSTALLKDLGGWDPVRTGADREFTRRLAAQMGAPGVRLVQKDIPMSFALDQATSLTRNPATHIRSVFFGTVNAYQSAFRRWHASATHSSDLRIDPAPEAPRRFPAPVPMLSERTTPSPFDVILIADFGEIDQAFGLAYEHMQTALQSGLRIGIFHWPRYDKAPREMDASIHTLIDQFEIEMLMPEQALSTDLLIVYSPGNLQYRLDRVPQISSEALNVVVDPMANVNNGVADKGYDSAVVRQTLKDLFGSEGQWSSIPPTVRTRAAAELQYAEPG